MQWVEDNNPYRMASKKGHYQIELPQDIHPLPDSVNPYVGASCQPVAHN